MTVDCKSMENKIKSLKKRILDEMKLKFGSKVDIDDLEEATLRRLVLELRVAMLNIRDELEKQLSSWNDTLDLKQIELKNTIRDNTARLEVLAVLNQEKASMAQLLANQTKKVEEKEKGSHRPDEYFTQDVSKLDKVVAMQRKQIEELKKEIEGLTVKSAPPEPIRPLVIPEKKKEEEGFVFTEFDPSLDEVYVPPPHVERKISILEKILAKVSKWISREEGVN